MLSRLPAGARAAGLVILAATALAACGGSDEPPAASPPASAPAPQPPAARLVVDTGSAAPVAGGTLTLRATVLGPDGLEAKGTRFTWTSSDEAVAVVTAASDEPPAAARFAAASVAPAGAYATVRTRAPGAADITATATLADGTRLTSVTHLQVQAAPAKSYTLTLSPATLMLVAGGGAQAVAVSVRRSDGMDGAADLIDWSWTSDEPSFAVSPAADGVSATISSPGSATGAATGTLTACANDPAGARLCANAALSRNALPPPTYTIGGTVTGLGAGKSLMLSDITGDALAVHGNGAFTLPTARENATPYAVSVSGQPAGQTCTVANGTGTIAAANVTALAVDCVQAQFVVVPNSNATTISVYRSNPTTGALAQVPGSPFPAGKVFKDIAFSRSGLIAYGVTTNAIVPLSFDAATGAIAEVAGASRAVPGAASVVANPVGPILHVGVPGGVRLIRLDAGGMPLNDVQGFSDPMAPNAMTAIAVSADGLRTYAAGDHNPNVLGFHFDPFNFGVGFVQAASTHNGSPLGIALSGDGKRLYTAEIDSNLVGIFALDPVDGTMGARQTFWSGSGQPRDIVLAPSGRFAYSYDYYDFQITGYQLDPLTGQPSNMFVALAGHLGARIKIDPAGKFLYAPTASGRIQVLAIDPDNGRLTGVPGSPFPGTAQVSAFAIVQPKP